MGMATLQFYKNKYKYPHYIDSLTAYGVPVDCTPVGMNFRSGSLRVAGEMTDFMSCNYLAFTRDGVTLYAWIDDVRYRNDSSFEVDYSVDAWRTYKAKIDLGNQFIARKPDTTNKLDKLLGGSQDYPLVNSKKIQFPNYGQRVFVVQVRPASGDGFSNSPVNPTPYDFYFVQYDVNNWVGCKPITDLMTALETGAQTENIVTMYSIPYIDLSQLTLSASGLPVTYSGGSGSFIAGYYTLTGTDDPTTILTQTVPITIDYDLNTILRVDHSVKLVIAGAGIIDIPDELLAQSGLVLRQDVDLFSGACNYMLMTGTQAGGDDAYYTNSVRGSSISSIPIISNPYDTYISQNQNALTVSMLGDVASVVGGVGMDMATAGAGSLVGTGMAVSGIKGIVSTMARAKDAGSKYENPPAHLGTALASNFNQTAWLVTYQTLVTNDTLVHSNFGYPWRIVDALTFPSSGFIQTEGCAVKTTDGTVPAWAIDEINGIFDAGVLVHTS